MLKTCQICINLHTGNTTLQKPKKGTILVMIDLSSAFDTIYHSIFLSRLGLRYGITSVVFEWFRSYLYGRVQRININDSFSPAGIPQGSVVGPLLFSLYVQPLGGIIQEHSIHFHHYADDLQLYANFDLNRVHLNLLFIGCRTVYYVMCNHGSQTIN